MRRDKEPPRRPWQCSHRDSATSAESTRSSRKEQIQKGNNKSSRWRSSGLQADGSPPPDPDAPLPEYCGNDGHKCDCEKENNESALEPILRLTAIEHNLEACKAQSHEYDPETINLKFSILPRSLDFARELRRVGDQPAGQNQRQNPYGNIDKEDPTPAPVVRNPTAERRPDHRCGHNGHAIQSKCRGPFLQRKCIHKNRLLDRS